MTEPAFISNLTFVVFTYNEEARLPLVIRNLKKYGSILVVDNYSSDSTLEIARSYGCRALMNRNEGGWMENQETCDNVQDAVSTDWMFWLSADELISADALVELGRLIESDKYDVISMLRKNYFQGVFCHNIAIGYRARAFKKNCIDFRGNTIHNFGKITSSPKRVFKMHSRYYIHHLISNTTTSYIDTIQRYTEMEKVNRDHGQMTRSTAYVLLVPFKAILMNYFLKGGRKAGRSALHLSVLMLIYSFIKILKGYDVQEGLTAEEIARRNRRIAEDILRRLPGKPVQPETESTMKMDAEPSNSGTGEA